MAKRRGRGKTNRRFWSRTGMNSFSNGSGALKKAWRPSLPGEGKQRDKAMKNARGKLSQNSLQRQRLALLAKVHIAANQMGLIDKDAKDDKGNPNDDYHLILRDEFGVESAAALSNGELEQLVARFESKGWQSKRTEAGGRRSESQLEALREKAGQVALHTDLTPARFRKLLFKVCGAHDLAWCNDVARLKRLLAILKKMRG
ncbi:MAG: hypothetical protein CVU64_14175 [Deltaproteobacteria bacterium HGW-Deltaproteobacteria-21]|nr:MAG: hypothetical protein CVU64_14175 [Deltaproteobacteria bacterium HGW-Deltaproteobacteria-21]